HVRRRRRGHPGPGDPVRRLASLDLRRAHVARLQRLCPRLRGAGADSDVWGSVRGFPRQRPTVDSAAVPLARRMRWDSFRRARSASPESIVTGHEIETRTARYGQYRGYGFRPSFAPLTPLE